MNLVSEEREPRNICFIVKMRSPRERESVHANTSEAIKMIYQNNGKLAPFFTKMWQTSNW